jgi:hypothetical protein
MHECRWGWCRLTFPIDAQLSEHVIHEHVRRAEPVRLGDLTALRRVDDGVGESLALSGAMSSGSVVVADAGKFYITSYISGPITQFYRYLIGDSAQSLRVNPPTQIWYTYSNPAKGDTLHHQFPVFGT